MQTQWKTYQALELIPESVSCPHPSFFARLVAPLRRSFSDTFVRDLSYRHQVLLFKRCLAMVEEAPLSQQEEAESPKAIAPNPLDIAQSSEPTPLNPQQQYAAQQWISRGGLPWWTWYDS